MFYIKKLFLKIPQYSQKISVLESVFNKVAGLKACKKRLQRRGFSVNIVKCLRTTMLKNICEQLLLFVCFSHWYNFAFNYVVINNDLWYVIMNFIVIFLGTVILLQEIYKKIAETSKHRPRGLSLSNWIYPKLCTICSILQIRFTKRLPQCLQSSASESRSFSNMQLHELHHLCCIFKRCGN